MDELINKKKSVDPISVIQKSAIEKLTNNLCNDLPTCDVAGQDTIRPSQAEIVKSNFPSKSTETKSSTSTLVGQQNKDKGPGCTATGLTGSPIGLTALSTILQNKSELKLVKPKKLEMGVWKIVQAKGHSKHQKKKPKPIHRELPIKFSKEKNIKHASQPINSEHPKSTPKQKFHNQNRQWCNPYISIPFPLYESPLHVS